MDKKLLFIIPIIFLLVFVLGCTKQEPVIQNGDNVSVEYVGKYESGVIFDQSKNQSLNFQVGSGQLIKGFDFAVIGMKIGESKTVTILPEQGYGAHRDDLVKQFNLSDIKSAGYNATVGTVVELGSGKSAFIGIIIHVNNTSANVDFNHPLAGKTLIFDIKVVDIKKESSNLFK